MESDNPTTVRFTEKAKPIKDELAPIYGLKNILSAGLMLFERLSDSEQKQIVREANSPEQGMTWVVLVQYAHGEITDEQYQRKWEATPAEVQKKFLKLFKEAGYKADAKVVVDAAEARPAKPRKKRSPKSSKSRQVPE